MNGCDSIWLRRAVLPLVLGACVALAACVSKTKAQSEARAAFIAGQQQAAMMARQSQIQGPTVTVIGEVRNALVYVLMNFKKHASTHGDELGIDAFSSAPWFDGFREAIGPPREVERPVVAARTWLGSAGWRRRGLVSLDELPATA